MGSIFARGQSPDSFLHIVRLVGRLPRVPCLCGRVQIFPLVRGSRVRACFQHRVFRDEEEGFVRDRVITCATLGFLLGGIECVCVLKDAFAVLVLLVPLDLEREDVDGVRLTVGGPATASG